MIKYKRDRQILPVASYDDTNIGLWLVGTMKRLLLFSICTKLVASLRSITESFQFMIFSNYIFFMQIKRKAPFN